MKVLKHAYPALILSAWLACGARSTKVEVEPALVAKDPSTSSTEPIAHPSHEVALERMASASVLDGLLARMAGKDADEGAVDIMMVGDSTANCLGWGLRSLHMPTLSVSLEAKDGCEILSETCGAADWAEKAKKSRARSTVILLGGAFLYGATAHDEWQKACKAEWNNTFETHLAEHLHDLSTADTQIWVATIPYPLGSYDTEAYRTEVDCINASIRKTVAGTPSVKLLELAHELCPTGHACRKSEKGRTLRPDGVHFDIEAIAPLSQWVLDQVGGRAIPPNPLPAPR